MAFSAAKGTVLQISIGTVLTTIAQVISLDGPDGESLTYAADTLDNGSDAIPYKGTGSSEGGSVSGELFFDPVLANHQAITDLITTNASNSMKIIWSDTGSTPWTFTAAGFSFSPSAALGDGLKATFAMKLDGIVSYTS
jgi:hypothetical protein